MSSRERVGPNHHGRVSQPISTGASRHETIYAASDHHRQRDNRLSHPEILENKIAVQAAEIDRLASDNRKLAASHIALREDLTVADREVQVLRAHIRNIETDSDVQIRGTLDKIVKMEAIIKNSESIRRELQLAHIEAHRLVREREELASQVQSKSKELKNLRGEVESVDESCAELERLREEHQRLRTSFEEEKNANVEKVGHLKEMDRNIIAAVKEIEKLRDLVARVVTCGFKHTSLLLTILGTIEVLSVFNNLMMASLVSVPQFGICEES